jgi:phosphatidylinositol alpha-1,6-mannosyltransferase
VSLPRLLLPTPDLPPARGGIQRLAHELALGLSSSWDVTVVAPGMAGAAAFDREQPFRVVRTHARWGGSRSVAVLGEMAVAARRARPDVVLAGHLVAAPLSVAASGRVAVMLYGGELWAPRSPAIIRLVAPRVSTWLSISDFTSAEAAARGVPAERIRLTPPGAACPPRPDDWLELLAQWDLADAETGEVRPFFLTLGRLAEPHKGQDIFIRSLPPLLAVEPRLRYAIVGEGPLTSHLRSVARSSGAADAVLLPAAGGASEAMKAALLHACRALVMISRQAPAAGQFEGFGIVFLEAALAGRPSLGGRSGGIPDAIVDGVTGLLVDPRDPVAIVEAALCLLEDPAYADELGARARRRAEEEFTWARSVERVDRELQALLS